MYERWGDAGVARCLGAFAFALWDAGRRRLILGRDCLGNRSPIRTIVATASWHTPAQFELCWRCRAFRTNSTNSFWRIFSRSIVPSLGRRSSAASNGVPSRTIADIDAVAVRGHQYWSPDLDAPPPFTREQDYVERARELFDQAVAAVIADTPHVAISASGGLNSSAIAATVAQLGRAESITCYSLVSPEGFELDVGRLGYLDEREGRCARPHVSATEGPLLRAGTGAPTWRMKREFSHGRACPHPVRPTSPLFPTSTMPPRRQDIASFWSEFAAIAGCLGTDVFIVRLASQRPVDHVRARTSQPSRRRSSGAGENIAIRHRVVELQPGSDASAIGCRGRNPDDVAWYTALNPGFIASEIFFAVAATARIQILRGRMASGARYRAFRLFDYSQTGRDSGAMTEELFHGETRDPHTNRRLLEFLFSVPEPMYRRNERRRSFARAVLANHLPGKSLPAPASVPGISFCTISRPSATTSPGEIERLEASPVASRMLDLPRLKRLLREWPADAQATEDRKREYRLALWRGVHVGRFIRWVKEETLKRQSTHTSNIAILSRAMFPVAAGAAQPGLG